MLVKGEEEAIVRILEEERYPNELGVIVPPISVELDGQEYILKRHYIENIYVYAPAESLSVDELLG